MFVTVLLLVLAITTAESAETDNWRSIGCFEAQDWNWFLRHTVSLEGKTTLEACALACHERHYDKFGLKDGFKCRCDDDLRKAARLPNSKCQTPCTEDISKKCGTGKLVQVYQYDRDAELKWAAWSAWSACSVTCGQNGKQKRTRQCMKVLDSEETPMNSIVCPGSIGSEDKSCNAAEPCYELKWVAWSAWGACSVSCVPSGLQKRTRQCMKVSNTNEEPAMSTLCPGNNDSEDQSCYATQPCDVFQWAAWSAWSACSVTCGQNGQQKRTRQCQKIAGSRQEIVNSTNCAGGSGAENKICSTNVACNRI